MLGGDLSAISTPGVGSTFTATIRTGPLEGVAMIDGPAEAALAPTRSKKAAAPEIGELKARILLAEDGPDNRRLITRFLESAGATVEQVENGALAVERVLGKGPKIDLILLDMQMPKMDGYTAAALLRQRGVTIPILAVTAHAMSGERDRCLAAGCHDYLTKPIPRRTLVEACRRWLEQGTRAAA